VSAYHYYTEDQLVAFLKMGDHAAFTEIYNRFWERLCDAAYQRLRSREDAEEVVQAVFVSLYVKREDLNLKTTLEAYLKAALKYKVIDAYRSQQLYYRHLDRLIADHQLLLPTPDKHIEIKELESQVLLVTHKLPYKCREVFIMSRFEQLSHQEIAERTGISISTIKKHIHKALSILRSNLSNTYLNILLVNAIVFKIYSAL
jgi:RNA polymerase sigma-70 factor (family 1)